MKYRSAYYTAKIVGVFLALLVLTGVGLTWVSKISFARTTGLVVLAEINGIREIGIGVDLPHSVDVTVSPTPSCEWEVVSSPNMPGDANYLLDVAVVADDDIWAVGQYGGPARTLIERWDGAQWSIIPSPNSGSDLLKGVGVIGSDDVWAVGTSYDSGRNPPGQAVIEHWDGAQWSVIPSPVVREAYLYDVGGVASNDVWAIGNYCCAGIARQSLIEHWDGAQWSVIPSPNVGAENNVLRGLTVISANDVWAVGSYGNMDYRTLTLHWNGTEWSVVPSPSPGPGSSLHGVDSTSSSDIWAVGSYSPNGRYVTLVLHWDGTQWSHVPSPNPSSNATTILLNDVTAISPVDVWTVGYYCCNPHGTLAMHWDGTEWRIIPNPSPGIASSYLEGVAAVSSNEVWAVGSYQPSGMPFQTLTERYSCDGSGGSTPSPTVQPTSSVSPPSATATATPCTITFTDVPSTNTFYSSIRCLACRGIISGYADGTFRPNNQVTRGQLAKIVSNSAGFSEPPTQQTFEDVLPTNTFYEWIERLTSRGYMTGYVCGGAGEPCVSGKPYFRPFSNATRGQTAKIVSNAAGFSEPPVGQTFEDVPTTHTFYEFIQRLATRNVMGGYQCGGPTEPCVPPGNRPYFRPGNDVTRGQSSKIVANAFYPDCAAR